MEIRNIIKGKETNFDFEGGYRLEKKDKTTFEKIPTDSLYYFINLINTIILDYKEYPNFSHFYNIENIYRFILNQIKSSICKIKKGGNIVGN